MSEINDTYFCNNPLCKHHISLDKEIEALVTLDDNNNKVKIVRKQIALWNYRKNKPVSVRIKLCEVCAKVLELISEIKK